MKNKSIMEANELMIGDWVKFADNVDWADGLNGKPVQVEGLRDDDGAIKVYDPRPNSEFRDFWSDDEDDFEPIPLTAEILEKNGFYASDVSPHHIKYVCSTGPIDEFADIVLICGKDNKDKWRWDCLELRIHYYRGDIHQFKINYVHELQHALRLCGVEKTIEL